MAVRSGVGKYLWAYDESIAKSNEYEMPNYCADGMGSGTGSVIILVGPLFNLF